MPEELRPYRSYAEKKAGFTPEELLGILKFLKPTEQESVRLYYGLEGREFHSLQKITERYPGTTLQELTLLMQKVERMIGIQKRENKNVPPGMVNVNRPKRRKSELEGEDFGIDDEFKEID
ncbi:MAG: hypothetical protein Q8P56_02320 [Candidatus Uhrbacteria bacterium]|nr:hypothetical protein [Candidatus Uhrbacteria bacterium]